MKLTNHSILLLAIALTLALVGCSQVGSDPVAITIPLHYTAPGDDGMMGQATTAQFRMATSLDELENNWADCEVLGNCQIIEQTAPWAPGVFDTLMVTIQVETGIDYYIAMKTADEVPNWSLISNIITRNFPDVTPPSPVGDLGFAD